jgi:hypothetical protein
MLYTAQPLLTELRSVAVAFLAVTSRYETQLRGAMDEGSPSISFPEVQRELSCLQNTQRPLAAFPSFTAAELVTSARNHVAVLLNRDS